jgi:hypothetical protein
MITLNAAWRARRLMSATAILVLAHLASLTTGDDDVQIPLVALDGLIFGSVLYVCLNQRPTHLKGIAGVLLLGVTNYFSFYANILLKPFFAGLPEPLAFLLPSMVGAVMTLVSLKYLWGYAPSRLESYLMVLGVALGSVIGMLFFYRVIEPLMPRAFSAVLNSAIWLCVVTATLLLVKRRSLTVTLPHAS